MTTPRKSAVKRRRCVILAPAGVELLRWLDVTSRYAQQRRFEVVTIASRPVDALFEITEGRADVIVVARPDHLLSLVEIVSEAVPAGDEYRRPGSRRVRLLQPGWDDEEYLQSRRTGRVVPRYDEESARPARLNAQVIPIRSRM